MQACVAAKIAKGEIVHVDASLIRADVSWESLAVRHVDAVAEANDDGVTGGARQPQDRQAQEGLHHRPRRLDGDHGRNRRLEPAYKQHAVVDDAFGVVLDVEVTTGEVNEGQVVLARIDAAADDDRRADPDGDRRRRLRLRQGLRRARAARDRGGDPGQGRADPQPRAAAPLPLRRAATTS